MPPQEKNNNVVTVISVLLVIAVLAVGVFVLVKQATHKNNPTTTQAVDVAKVINDSTVDNAHGNYDAAITSLNQALGKVTSAQDKYQLLMALGATYVNKKDYKDAEATFQQADTVTGGTYGSTLSLAQAADANGDNKVALAAYERAENYVKTGKQQDNSDMPDIQAAITRLGGKP